MQPNSSTPQGPTGRSFLLIIGALVVAIAVIGAIAVSALNAVAAPAAAAPRPSSSAWPKPSASASPSPSPEPTVQPTAQPTPEPTAVPPTPEPAADPYYDDVSSRLVRLNERLLDLTTKTSELSEDPFAALDSDWIQDWGLKAAKARAVADMIRSMTPPAGAEQLHHEAFTAAGEAYRVTEHMAGMLDSAAAGDTETNSAEQAAWKNALGAYTEHMKAALALLPRD